MDSSIIKKLTHEGDKEADQKIEKFFEKVLDKRVRM